MSIQEATEGGTNPTTESPSVGDATRKRGQDWKSPFSPEDSSLPLAVSFPNDLRLYRQRKGLKQKELAEALKLPRSRLSLWEGGRALPSLKEASLLATFLGVAVSQLWPDPRVQSFIAKA